MTLARDAREEQRLRASLSFLAALNVPVFVTDGGSGQTFLDFLRGFANFRVLEAGRPGLWPQVRRSVRAAADSAFAFILYTEPDKLEFFRDSLRAFLSEAPGRDDAGVVLASRSAASFATFPEFQQHTETTINRCCGEVIGAHLDYTYGPFLVKREIASHLDAAPEEIGWGWRTFAFGAAHRLGYKLSSLVRDLPCPAEQRQDDPAERLYRMRQLSQNIEGLILSTTAVRTPKV